MIKIAKNAFKVIKRCTIALCGLNYWLGGAWNRGASKDRAGKKLNLMPILGSV